MAADAVLPNADLLPRMLSRQLMNCPSSLGAKNALRSTLHGWTLISMVGPKIEDDTSIDHRRMVDLICLYHLKDQPFSKMLLPREQ